jgi:hypothetical protein
LKYIRIEKGVLPYLTDELEREDMSKEIVRYNEEHYTQENLDSGIAYPSDNSSNRTSHAYLANGQSRYPLISGFLYDWDVFLDIDLDEDNMSLINFQSYRGDSSPVYPHQDGHYLDFEVLSEGDMKVKEALVPQYVGVLVVHNDNKSGGTVLTTANGSTSMNMNLPAGSMLIFDNVKFLHSVPAMEKSRSIIGIRNFLHNPYMYSQEIKNAEGVPLKHTIGEFFEGYINQISSSVAKSIYEDARTYEEAPF